MTIPIGHAEFITTAANPGGYPPPGPPEVAFAGRSNVGKSSLINTLTRRKKLVRVSGTPGRTQHINFFNIHQDALRLVDLPGYGYAKVPKAIKAAWKPMVEAYLGGRETLAGVVVILDIRREPTADDLMLLDWLKGLQIPSLVAITKADKLSKNKQTSRLAKLRPVLAPFDSSPTLFSASTRLGREQLWARICDAAGV